MKNDAVSIKRRSVTHGTATCKPLYLATDAADVDLSHESALVVKNCLDGSRQHFPLDRIERVICNAQVNWHGRALMRCLEYGVPVVWLDKSGHTLGVAQPPANHAGNDTMILLESYVSMPHWLERFDNWRSTRRLETLVHWAKRARDASVDVSDQCLQEYKRDYVMRDDMPVRFDSRGHAWCTSLAMSLLKEEGLPARFYGFNGSALNLADAIAQPLWAELNLDTGPVVGRFRVPAAAVRFFESWASQNAYRLGVHLADLKRHAAAEIDEWY